MATYKQPSKVANVIVGEMPVKQALKANQSLANERSNPYDGVKTSGIKIRGTGCATKGTMARGPMA